MKNTHEIIIPPMSAYAFCMKKGQSVTIVDLQGKQPGDMVAFSAGNMDVHFSQARTRVENHKTFVTAGDSLWTNTFPPEIMFTICEDTFGFHDLLYPPCCRYALRKRFGVLRDGCLENLVKALNDWNIPPEKVPDPLNLFFRVSVNEEGGMTLLSPSSRQGDFIKLKAEMDCVVAISTCSVPLQDKENTAYRVFVL